MEVRIVPASAWAGLPQKMQHALERNHIQTASFFAVCSTEAKVRERRYLGSLFIPLCTMML